MTIVMHNVKILKESIPNPIPLRAGTDIFQEYLIRNLEKPSKATSRTSGSTTQSHQPFEVIRDHLLQNANLFALRAKEARDRIALRGAAGIQEGQTIMTHGGSRAVSAILLEAAERRSRGAGVPFRVIYVKSGQPEPQGEGTVASLREMGIRVAVIAEGSVGYSMRSADAVLIGAEAVCGDGGIISRLGTSQLAMIARSCNVPVKVAAETHKIVNAFPMGQDKLPEVEQKILDFKSKDNMADASSDAEALEKMQQVDYTVS